MCNKNCAGGRVTKGLRGNGIRVPFFGSYESVARSSWKNRTAEAAVATRAAWLLLPAEQADAAGEGAAFAGGEGGAGMSGIDHVIDDEGITAASNVVEAAAQGQVVAEKMEPLFELQVQRDYVGIALCAGRTDELLLVGEQVVGESGAGFERIGDFELVEDGKFEEREVSPGKKAVGSVPGVGAGLLGAKDGTVDIEVEGLTGVGAGAGVGAHQHVTPAEVVAQADLQGLVVVGARVVE